MSLAKGAIHIQGTKAHVGGWDGGGGGEGFSKFDVGKEGKENPVYTKGTSTATSGTPLGGRG